MPQTITDPRIQFMHSTAVIHGWLGGQGDYEDAMECLSEARSSGNADLNMRLDDLLLREAHQARGALNQAQEALDESKKVLDQFGAAPLYPAIFVAHETTRLGEFAVVACAGGRRVVAIAPEAEADALRCGDGVYLSADQSVLFAASPSAWPPLGEIGKFVRYTVDGRVVLTGSAEEQTVFQPVATLAGANLQPGDTVRYDRSARLALEKMEEAEANPFALEQVPDLPLSQVGGQAGNWRRLETALLNCLIYPERARAFHLPASNLVLLYGPPGTGKTYLTRAVCSEIQRRSGKKVMFAVVKAASWESPYVGVTQQNISALFHSLRRAAAEGHIAAVFIDEIDAVGRARGTLSGIHADRALGTLLTELSGFEELANVSVIAAVNRKDLLDSALDSRFSTQIAVGRPDMAEAQAILSGHLDDSLPYATPDTRQEMIDLAVSRLYAPNANTEVCTLKLRDGRTRTVSIRELVSARLIRQISESARRRGLSRWNETGEKDFRVDDMEQALDEARARLAETITPHNAHNQLETLPADEVVVAVEAIHHRIPNPRRYVRLA